MRHFGGTARIDVKEDAKQIINENIDAIEKKFMEIGFNKIMIADFKSGNLNLIVNARE